VKQQERLIAQPARAAQCPPAELLAELAKIRKDGYCFSHGERVLGLSAIAAPIHENIDAVNYCITITAPTVRLKPRLDDFVKALLKTTGDISRRFGAEETVTVPPAAPRARPARKVSP
jgi:DNA-binding IclR family transcriptional regulator